MGLCGASWEFCDQGRRCVSVFEVVLVAILSLEVAGLCLRSSDCGDQNVVREGDFMTGILCRAV